MKCKNCGFEYEGFFCPKCGTKNEEEKNISSYIIEKKDADNQLNCNQENIEISQLSKILKWISSTIIILCMIVAFEDKCYISAILLFISGICINPAVTKNRKQKGIVIFAVVILFFIGCMFYSDPDQENGTKSADLNQSKVSASNKTSKSVNKKTEQALVATSTTTISNTTIHESTEENTKMTEEETTKKIVKKTYNLLGEGCQDFKNGYAFVITKDISFFCINTEGEIVFEGDSYNGFENGVAIAGYTVKPDNSETEIGGPGVVIDETGAEIWSLGDGEEVVRSLYPSCMISNQRMNEDNFEGYTFVEYTIDSFEYSGKLTGIVNPNGELYYLEPGEMPDIWDKADTGIYTGLNGGTYYILLENRFTDSIEEAEEWAKKYRRDKNQGVQYYTSVTYSDERINIFYDANDNVIIDLSEYNIKNNPEFLDDYCFLEVENEQGSIYGMIIDIQGNITMKPTKVGPHSKLSNGLMWVEEYGTDVNHSFQGGRYIDVYGNTVLSGFSQGRDFSCGIALVKDKSGVWKYINKNGEVIFQ